MQEGLGPCHVGETQRDSWAQTHLLAPVAVPRAGPFTVPGETPASPPTTEGVQLGEGPLGGASSVTFFWVGLAHGEVASQAVPHLKHPSVRDSLMQGHGVQALRVLSLLFQGGVALTSS